MRTTFNGPLHVYLSKRPKLPSGADSGRVRWLLQEQRSVHLFSSGHFKHRFLWFSGGLRDGLEDVGQAPGQQLGDAADRVVGDLGQHRAQEEFRIEAGEFGRADQRLNGGGPLAARIGAGEEIVFSAMQIFA
jgi:hypothetical protein